MGSDLNHCGGQIGLHPGDSVGTAKDGAASVDVGAAVLSPENSPLGEDGKTVQTGGTACTDDRIGDDFIVKGDVDAVVAAVEGGRLYLDVRVQQLGAADPGGGAGIQNALGAGG